MGLGNLFKKGGDKKKDKGPSESFRYLEDLIHSGKKEIVLETDIVFSRRDKSSEYALHIDVPGLVIDGNGHSIDGKGKTGMFSVDEAVTFKNLTFENASSLQGAALTISAGGGSDIIIDNCKFINNKTEMIGGAIVINMGNVKITDSTFKKNSSSSCAAIACSGRLTLENCIFDENVSNSSGIVANTREKMTVKNCEFNNNECKNNGIISAQVDDEIDNCTFNNNKGEDIEKKS